LPLRGNPAGNKLCLVERKHTHKPAENKPLL